MVVHGEIAAEPRNLGPGWIDFDFARAFACPVKLINDAAMQALGSYEGGHMLFLGLGTGLGSAMVFDGVIAPMEIAHLPYRNGKSFEMCVGEAGLERSGLEQWRADVAQTVALFTAALLPDYVVLGGGNVRLLETLPPKSRLGDNANALPRRRQAVGERGRRRLSPPPLLNERRGRRGRCGRLCAAARSRT